MNDRQRRLKSIQSQLLQIYEDLFGVKYKSTGDVDEGTQFKAILQRFREKHFFIRQMQKDRQKKQKKGGQLAQQLLKNEKIRQELKMCQNLLKEAQNRIKNGIKHEDKSIGDKTLKSRKLMLDECYEMLNNLRTVQYGDSFEPKKKHQTLDQFKKRLIKEEINEVNLQQEQALQRFHRKDEDIEGLVTQIRNVDNTVKNNLRTANQKIGLSQQMIANNLQLANKVDVKIQKGTTDLRQVLKHYRRPSKLCLDVILVCLLLALVGVIINMLKGSL